MYALNAIAHYGIYQKQNNMTQTLAKKEMTIKELIAAPYVAKRFNDVLGAKAPAFVASVLQAVSSNDLLSKAEPNSILNAAMVAATINLPINQNLGFAYIIPYKNVAQFQMGYKGFIQLAMRSGQFQTLNVTDVRQGELKGFDRLSGQMDFVWADKDRDTLPVIGFVAYMKLTNGFEKSFYMTAAELKKHGAKFSQSAKKGYGLWVEDFDSMAKKTCIKLLLSRYAPMTTEMSTAQLADQAVIKKENEFEYIDNEEDTYEKIDDEVTAKIMGAKDLHELVAITQDIKKTIGSEYTRSITEVYGVRKKELEDL